MATETTRVSSYIRSEGFVDSAGTRYQYASAVNNLVSGLIASANYTNMNDLFSGLATAVRGTALTNLVSGLVTGVNASTLNDCISGITVSAGQLNFASGYPASAAYAASAGTAANATTAATAAAATTALAAASASYAASAGTLSGLTANASAINNVVSGLTTAITASALVNIVSGLVTGVNASSLNDIISGATVSAGQINFSTGFPASVAYAVSAGTLSGVSAAATEINTLLYGTKYKVYFGSALATDLAIATTVTAMGIATALFAFVNAQVTGIIANAIATQTGIQWLIVASDGTATQSNVDYFVVGNA